MLFYKHLTLPKIPDDLLTFGFHYDEFLKTLDYGTDHYLDGKRLDPPLFMFKDIINPRLKKWVENLFSMPFNMCLSVTRQQNYGRMIVHQDRERTCALNYIINPGGESVVTNWFQESGQPIQRQNKRLPESQSDTGKVDYKDLVLLDSVEGKLNNWYLVRTDVLHDVANITGDRILLQVIFTDYNDPDGFDKLLEVIKY